MWGENCKKQQIKTLKINIQLLPLPTADKCSFGLQASVMLFTKSETSSPANFLFCLTWQNKTLWACTAFDRLSLPKNYCISACSMLWLGSTYGNWLSLGGVAVPAHNFSICSVNTDWPVISWLASMSCVAIKYVSSLTFLDQITHFSTLTPPPGTPADCVRATRLVPTPAYCSLGTAPSQISQNRSLTY